MEIQTVLSDERLKNMSVESEIDIEERIDLWLSSNGVHPDNPSSKKHCYFERSKKSLTNKFNM